MARILLSVPSFDRSIRSRTAEALGNLDACGNEVEWSFVGGYGIERARNFMAQKALDGGYDYLLMCDSDMLPPRDGLEKLLSHDLEVCTGWAVRGTSDDGLTSVIGLETAGFSGGFYASELSRYRDSGMHLMEVKANGMAFALVNTDVFRRFNRPWFKYVDHADGSALGEDYWFCLQCRSVGVRVYVDTRVGCGHIHDRVLEAR